MSAADQGAVDEGTGTLSDDGGTQTLSLLAGGLGGPGYIDDVGSAARFNTPYGVASDGAGNLYVADTFNNTIRKIVVSTGEVSTFVGTAGPSGSTDGTGAAARFGLPYGVASDGVGNLYVIEGSNTIRRVVIATKVVSTLAGDPNSQSGSTDGTGAAARFNNPQGIASDGAGNLYVADTNNNTIRKVVVATGEVSTLAGNPNSVMDGNGIGDAARFSGPWEVASDGAGNLYVADNGNSTIRKVIVATGAVSTVAGAAFQAGSADGTGDAARFNIRFPFATTAGVTSDRAGNVYVSDPGNQTIRKVEIATGMVSTLAGSAGQPGSTDGTGAAARFNYPSGMTSDGAGNIYVADSDNNTIRKVEIATGAVSTVAGTAGASGSADGTGTTARFNGPIGVASDGAGNVYVVDNQTIRKVEIVTGAVSTVAGTAGAVGSTDGTGAAARFYSPYGMASDGTSNLYVADTGNKTIRKVEIATRAVTTVAGAAGQFGSTDGTGAAARFFFPNGIASDGGGHLYVADSFNHAIRKVALASGAVSTFAGVSGLFIGVRPGPLPAGLAYPATVAVVGSSKVVIDENSVLIIH